MSVQEGASQYEVYRPTIVAGRYRITGVLRQDGGRDVLRALDVRTDRSVVLKRVTEPARGDITRLRTIHRVLSGLRNPSVMEGLDLVEGKRDSWLVSAEVPGPTLSEYLRRLPLGRDASFTERCRFAGPLLSSLFDGLQALHSAQIAHLDVKPENVRITPSRRAVLVGVGMGRSLREGGEPDQPVAPEAFFRAPELLDGLYVSRMADQWALGAVAYLLLTGRAPMSGVTLADLERAYESARVPALREWRPDTPRDVEDAVLRMLRWEPDERYDELRAARDALKAVLRPVPPIPLQPWCTAPPPLVGRSSQTRVFERHLVGLRAGRGAVLKLEDDEGAGKTRLLEHWAGIARRSGGLRVYEAACLPASPDAVLHGWFEPDPEIATHGAEEAIPSALSALGGASVILLDDLDSCRADSWTVIRKVAEAIVRRATHHPILLVLSAEQLPETKGRLPSESERALNIFLPPLTEADVGELLRAERGDAGSIESIARVLFAKSEGQPQALHQATLDAERDGELARSGNGWSPTPSLGQGEVGAPPAAMSELFTQLAEIGGPVEVDLLLDSCEAELVDVVAALDWAARNDLLETFRAGGRWWARAASPTETAPLDSGRTLNRRVAEWLEHNSELGGLTAERIAHHWRRAGEPRRAAERFRDAVRALLSRGQTGEARRLLQLARTFESRT